MGADPPNTPADGRPRPTGSRRGDVAFASVVLVSAYLVTAYLILPAMWQRHELRHPGLGVGVWVTRTADGIPGDPVNVGLIGSEESMHRAMLKAGWFPADPITLGSSLRIVGDVIFRKPYVEAPVSSLYLFNRKQDFTFEQPVGDDPSRRHHVRFWKCATPDSRGRPIWLGAATLDTKVGFSHDTGQITHHIAPDVDAERDMILAQLSRDSALTAVTWKGDLQSLRGGRNGGGDPWRSDGRVGVGVLIAAQPGAAATTPVASTTRAVADPVR